MRYHFGVFILLFSFLAQQRSVAVAKPLSSQSNQGKKDIKNAGTPSGTLFVIVVVDQMRSDYVSRFAPLFKAAAKQQKAEQAAQNQGDGGFGWFMASGANFTNARTASAPTVTAAGHASLCTGTSPILSGIPANEYFDRELDRVLPMVFDAQAKVVRTPGLLGKGPLESSADDGVSGSKLRTAPLGERINAFVQSQSGGKKKGGVPGGSRKGRSIALSMKDRAAMVCAGRNSDGAYYFDDKSGSMVTSSAASSPERTSLPEWVDAFNRRVRPEKSRDWKLFLSDRKVYETFLGEDLSTTSRAAAANEKKGPGRPPGEFPLLLWPRPDASLLEIYQRFQIMPAASDYLVDFALDAVTNEKLGQDGATDVLVLSFSTPDAVGHGFGQSSMELVDTYLWLNQSLERLRNGVDQRVGKKGRVVWALSADHGVQQIPEVVAAKGGVARRVDGKTLVSQLNDELSKMQAWGKGEWIKTITTEQLIFNDATLKSKGRSQADLAKDVVQLAQKLPYVFAAYSRDDVAAAAQEMQKSGLKSEALQAVRQRSEKDYALQYLARGFDVPIAGDVYLVFAEGSIMASKNLATHGSVWEADARIPLIIVSPGLVAERTIDTNVYADDLVPTLIDLVFGKGSSSQATIGTLTGVSRAESIRN